MVVSLVQNAGAELAISGVNPQVGRAGVRDDSEFLIGRADGDINEVLSIHEILDGNDRISELLDGTEHLLLEFGRLESLLLGVERLEGQISLLELDQLRAAEGEDEGKD